MAISFMECTSLNISYDVMGIATVSFTMVHDTPEITVRETVTAGNQIFTGYVMEATMTAIPKTEGWYETHVTLIATTN